MLKMIDGVVDRVIEVKFQAVEDERGSLREMFRVNKLPYDLSNGVLMAYWSITKPGVVRGPHEHKYQYDNFVFIGDFELYLWAPYWNEEENDDKIVREKRTILCGQPEKLITIPPAVVHAYKNISKQDDGIVMNFPSQYYGGWSGHERVDEIRHEQDANTIYQIW